MVLNRISSSIVGLSWSVSMSVFLEMRRQRVTPMARTLTGFTEGPSKVLSWTVSPMNSPAPRTEMTALIDDKRPKSSVSVSPPSPPKQHERKRPLLCRCPRCPSAETTPSLPEVSAAAPDALLSNSSCPLSRLKLPRQLKLPRHLSTLRFDLVFIGLGKLSSKVSRVDDLPSSLLVAFAPDVDVFICCFFSVTTSTSPLSM
mmetsp:Transcript_9520/g.15212  ORF Transcript_9520/g.15212 Transcript_9520/m.15212 type:complete len:201 (+) Transcript_9520:630-1232(+)